MKKLYNNLKEEIIPLSRKQYLSLFLYIAVIFQFVLFFSPVLAKNYEEIEQERYTANLSAENIEESIDFKEEMLETSFPVHESLVELYNQDEYQIISSGVYTMTAYNSEEGQTDSTPCITANGFNVCEHGIEDTVAANFLPFGTKVRIPDLFGDRIFIVRDRMNARYTHRVDIWMLDKSDALQFGIKNTRIEVIKEI